MKISPPWSRDDWNDMVKIRVTAWHERKLRSTSTLNSKMAYLNVELQGLSGRPHPVLMKILNVQEIKKVRAHLKFLALDFPHTSQRDGNGLRGLCNLCSEEPLCIAEHLLVICRSTSDVRSRLFPELVNVVASIWPQSHILQRQIPPKMLTQFILDPTSFNLPNDVRLPINCPNLEEIFRVSRDWCYANLMLYKRSSVP